MTYRKNDKTENIKEVQRYLYSISHFSENIPEVHPDGFFGAKTEDAVRAFQQEYNLPVTGEINHLTFDTIVIVYRHLAASPPEKIDIFPECEYSLSEGDKNDIVYFLQIMLCSIHKKYPDIPQIKINGIYDRNTADAVKYIQKISLFPETGMTDKYTWNSIVKTFRHISR